MKQQTTAEDNRTLTKEIIDLVNNPSIVDGIYISNSYD